MKKIAAFVMALSICFASVSCSLGESDKLSSTDKIVNFIESGNYADAYKKYQDVAERKDDMSKINEKVIAALKKQYSSVIEDYASDKIPEKELSSFYNLAHISGADTTEKYSKFMDSINTLDVSFSYYEKGMEFYENNQYDDAIYYLEYVIEEDTQHYSKAQEVIDSANTKLQEEKDKEAEAVKLEKETAETEIHDLISTKKYDDALDAINNYIYNYGESGITDSLNNELFAAIVKDMNETVDEYFESLDYSSAYDYLSELYSKYPLSEINQKISSLEDDFANYAISEAEKDAADENYEGASALVKIAMDEVGEDNAKLYAAYTEYRTHLPVYIVDIDYMSCVNSIKYQGTLKDNLGNLYHNGLFMCRDVSFIGDKGWYGEGSADYYTQGKYSSFSGTVAVPSGNESTNCSAYFEIFGDGELLYTSPVMEKTSFPESFSIDITDVKVLKISYPESNDRADMATIYDGTLTP